MRLHIVAEEIDVILQLAAHGLEAVAQGDVEILVREVGFSVRVRFRAIAGRGRGWSVRDDEVLARHAEGDVDVERIAMPVRALRRLDDDVATVEAVEERFEFLHFLSDVGDYSVGRGHVAEGGLDGLIHSVEFLS